MALSWRVILVALCLAIIFRRPPLSHEGIADVIFKNATIYTGDPTNTWAKAIAIRKGRIIEVGSYDIVQPQHLLDDASFASKKLGKERALKESYLFKSLLLRNTTLAFGSDWPVVRLNPLKGILAATKRKPAGWTDSWIPAECIDVEAALRGYTLAAAYASFMDDEIGSLSQGKYADFAVLSGDVFHDEGEVSVLATYKGGIRVFSREEE